MKVLINGASGVFDSEPIKYLGNLDTILKK